MADVWWDLQAALEGRAVRLHTTYTSPTETHFRTDDGDTGCFQFGTASPPNEARHCRAIDSENAQKAIDAYWAQQREHIRTLEKSINTHKAASRLAIARAESDARHTAVEEARRYAKVMASPAEAPIA